MGDRSALAVTRNPLLALPGAVALQELPDDSRAAMAAALRAIQADARIRADKCWRTHKAPMAVYWKAVGVYCGHLARLLSAQPLPAADRTAGSHIGRGANHSAPTLRPPHNPTPALGEAR